MSENRYKRKPPFRRAREEVLVVCGGQTEQIYFDTFKKVFKPLLGNISVVTAVKTKNPIRRVDYAIKMRLQNEGYNTVWCVFDKDDFADFDEAIDCARKNRIDTAFSNQAFEIWFINHYKQFSAPLHRRKHNEELTQLLSALLPK